MVQPSLIVAFDLGTSTATSNHVLTRDYLDNQGKLHRKKLGNPTEVKDWPEVADIATGNCVPTILIYRISTCELVFWGFEAKNYLEDPFHELPRSDVFVVETIKLLLPDPEETQLRSAAASERYQALRRDLMTTLNKHPDEVFEDLLNSLTAHVLDNARRKYSIGLHNHQIELVLAFPSGWPHHIHTTVARIGARALQKAITAHNLRNMTFGIENVYTVSETICGVKEWLREEVEEAPAEFEPQAAHLDEFNEGDCFLTIDIGAGTGCLTPLKLVSKHPLGVEQLDKTLSLEVSGEAVQAEFERMLRARITKKDYPEDLEQAIYQICRKFEGEKRKCAESNSKTWNCPVTDLKANPRKGFEKNCMKFNRKHLNECFDPVIDILDRAIEDAMRKFPSIKVIVFLGQFGGSSKYLQDRMARNPISRKVKIRHSQSGKLDVVRGAISERLNLEETFVRKFKTLKSYGTLVTLLYTDIVARIFPSPQAHGALPFQHAEDGLRLFAIEWAIPKEAVIQDGRAGDIGKDGPKHHIWPFSEDGLGFYDLIIVSDEDVPAPQLGGKSFTMWTEAHEKNQLYILGKKMHVQKLIFHWDLIMSQKLDAQRNIVGPYERDNLETLMIPEKKIKGHRRRKFRKLNYNLIWEITEMQVKVYVQAVFPNQVGPPLSQIAKEETIGPDETAITGESRSKALDKDIEISYGKKEEQDESDGKDDDTSEDGRHDMPHKVCGLVGSKLSDGHDRQNQQFGAETPSSDFVAHQQKFQIGDPRITTGQEQLQPPLNSVSGEILRQPATPPPWARALPLSSPKTDCRRREGCYTCKYRKKKCDCAYLFDETSGTQKCSTCLRVGIRCDTTEPDRARDSVQRETQQHERERSKLGKRKSRDESESSGSAARGRSTTIVVADYGHQPASSHSMEKPIEQITQAPAPVRRGPFKAIRGGKGGSMHMRS